MGEKKHEPILIVRKLRKGDVDRLLDIVDTDDYYSMSTTAGRMSRRDLKEFFFKHIAIRPVTYPVRMLYVVELQETKQIVGFVELINISWRHKTVTLFDYLIPEYRTTGLRLLSLWHVMCIAFSEFNMRKVQLYISQRDNAWIGMIRDTLKFTREGALRHYVEHNGTWDDYFVFAFFKRDFSRLVQFVKKKTGRVLQPFIDNYFVKKVDFNL
ncbi:GNAT family N-acetyltransferase [Candidatus Margulisiibacteriota bacterium]